MKTVQWQTIAFPVLIVALSLLIYGNTLRNEFTFDDYREIVNNPLIRNLNWGRLWWAYIPGPGKIRPPGRFSSLLTFSLNYAVGGTDPFGYHLANILLNSGISLLIYLVGLELFPRKYRLSFLTALLFASHPVHSEVVAAAVGRAELLSSFCFLLALRIYLRSAGTERAGWTAGYWISLPILLFGVHSKATAWTLSLVAAVFDFYRFKISPGKPWRGYIPIFFYRLKKFYLLYFLIPAFDLVLKAEMYPSKEEIAFNYLVILPFLDRIAAAEVCPESGRVNYNLALEYSRRGMLDRAIGILLIARRLDQENWKIFFDLGDAYLMKGDFEEAAGAYRESLRLNPDHWQAWNKLWAMKLRLEKPREAIADLRKAIVYFPECKEAYNNLGLSYALLGENEEAELAYRKTLEIDPGFMKARNNLKRLLNK